MKAVDSFKMDKSALSAASTSEEPDDKEYWHAKTPQERLQAVELMRQINYGYDPVTTRLQRVLEVVQFIPSGEEAEG